jgi:peptidoglycan hydrolase-like protein with peptidoglycan-binding domain
MKQYLVIAVSALLPIACSHFGSGESAEAESSGITIALDRKEDLNIPARNTSKGLLQKQTHRQGTKKADLQAIYRAQEKLKQSGYNPGPLDGMWGPKTQQAIKSFQRDRRLQVTGHLDEETNRQLMLIPNGSQRDAPGAGDLRKPYSFMTGEEARKLIEKHIKRKDIRLDTNALYRKLLTKSDSEGTADIFQGVKFDDENYLVIALCEPGYRMVKPSEDLPGKLAKQNIAIPDDDLSFTFNGVLYTSVNLEVKTHPVFFYTEQGGFINNDQIPKGGYRLMAGDFGMSLGNSFIIYANPQKTSLMESWNSRPNVYMIKISLPENNGILLNLYKD